MSVTFLSHQPWNKSYLDGDAAIAPLAAPAHTQALLVEDGQHLLAGEHLGRHPAHPHLLLGHLRLRDPQVRLPLVAAHRPAPVRAHTPPAHEPLVLMLETVHGALRQERGAWTVDLRCW